MLLRELIARAFDISKTQASREIEAGSIRINDIPITKNKNAEIYYNNGVWVLKDNDIVKDIESPIYTSTYTRNYENNNRYLGGKQIITTNNGDQQGITNNSWYQQ